MTSVNPFTLCFLRQYPVEAARILEKLPMKEVAFFIEQQNPDDVIPTLEAMTPDKAASCLIQVSPRPAASLLERLDIALVGNVYRRLSQEIQGNLSPYLSTGTEKRLKYLLGYPALTAGDLMDSSNFMVPKELTVSEVIERLEKNKKRVGCDIHVVDQQHRLVGLISIDSLLTSPPKARLGELMDTSFRPISARSSLQKISKRREWKFRRTLPVIDPDGTLVGSLTYARLQDAIESDQNREGGQDSLVSLFSLYWLFLGQLSAALLKALDSQKGPKR